MIPPDQTSVNDGLSPGDKHAETATGTIGPGHGEDAARFLSALFGEDDIVLVRLVETWTEDGRKRSRVAYAEVAYRKPKELIHPATWAKLLDAAKRERANVFFGVCPRFGPAGRYDLACQIRKVTTLWADLDNCSVQEARQRCQGAGLPEPSIIIRSGHGVHLYWLLAEPYRIDDVGEPPPVMTEWVEAEGRKRLRRYIVDPETKTKAYLFRLDPRTGADSKTHTHEYPDLSQKAVRLQDVMGGIAAKIGGDHTTDLARLLRLPGTLNRKDERNGKEPVPCELIECNTGRRYSFAAFEKFAELSPDRLKAKELAKVRLPSVRKLTPQRQDKLNALINVCNATPAGQRSEPDYHLCARAIELGVSKEQLWLQVEEVGKFGERGRPYFDRTWEKAEAKVRAKIHERARGRGAGKHPGGTARQSNVEVAQQAGFQDQHESEPGEPNQNPNATPGVGEAGFTNFIEAEGETETGKPRTVRIGLPVQRIAGRLFEITGGFPKRTGELLFADGPGQTPLWLVSHDDLFGWIGSKLPGDHQNVLRWARGVDMVSQAQFAAYLRQTAEDFEAVELFPHWPPRPRTYYHGAEPKPSANGSALGGLLQWFSLATPADRDLLLAVLLTLLWGGEPGQRPAVLITSNDEGDSQKGRGAGKTTVARKIGQVFGGLVLVDAKEEMAKVKTRLLSSEGRGRRVVLIDNIKSLKFSWAELEAMITSNVISGHQMYVGEGRRPNTFTWFLTVNGASMSRDMAQRVVTIKVSRADYDGDWETETTAYIEKHREAIIGDLLAILKAPGAKLAKFTRWAAWEAAVLSRVGDPSECQKVIAERQAEIDEDENESATVRDAFVAELARRGHDPEAEAIRIPAGVAAAVVNTATGERYPVPKASALLRTLAIPELRKLPGRRKGRAWEWRGDKAQQVAEMANLRDAPFAAPQDFWDG